MNRVIQGSPIAAIRAIRGLSAPVGQIPIVAVIGGDAAEDAGACLAAAGAPCATATAAAAQERPAGGPAADE